MKKEGFTLIEVLIVIAIFTVISGIALFINFKDISGYSFRSERDILITSLYKARNQAINNICLGPDCVNGKPHGIALHPLAPENKYIIFQGSNFANRDATIDEIISLGYAINIAGDTEIIFSNLSGDATPAQSSITISDKAGHSSVITINSEGQITWTN